MTNSTFEIGGIAPEPRSKLYWAVSDSLVLINRSTRHITRNFENVLVSIVVPVMTLLLFRYMFGGAINTGDISYANYVLAGVIVQGIAWNTTATAVSVCNDLNGGLMDRFRSMPMLGSAVITGHVVASLVRNLLSTIVVIVAGLIVGFRPMAGGLEWIGVSAVLLLYMLAISYVSAVFGMIAKTPEGATGLTFILIFAPYFSSAFVPTGHMPALLRLVTENQPFTHITETLRALTLGTPIGDHGGWAVAWCMGILVVTYVTAGYLFKRKTSR
jgi:ABC-2 type transport system permease protein